MPIKLSGVVDTLDSVPEAYRDRYEADGASFRLKEIEFDDPVEFKTKLNKKEQLLTETNKKLGRYSKLQELEDDEIEELLTLREKAKSAPPPDADRIERAEHERLLDKKEKQRLGEIAERDGKIAGYEQQLKKYKLIDPLRAIWLEAGGFPEDFDVAMLEIASRFKLVEEEGKKPRIVVLDEDKDDTDTSPKEFFEKLYAKQRPKFFKSRTGHGSGADNKQNGGNVAGVDYSKLSPQERLRVAREAGITK